MRPLDGLLVVDLTRYLPGAFAGRELLRLGARVVRLEPPSGDPMRSVAPAWDNALNAGKESVICDLKAEARFGKALVARADVVLEGFRPGVAARLGVGPDDAPESTVYCSITGFGVEGSHAARAGHDLNYLGWAGVLADTAPSPPPVQAGHIRKTASATSSISPHAQSATTTRRPSCSSIRKPAKACPRCTWNEPMPAADASVTPDDPPPTA